MDSRMDDSLNFHACIFDFDGILVDSEVVLVKLWKRIAGEYHYDFSEQSFQKCLGRTTEDIKQIQMDEFGSQYPFDEIYQKVHDSFHQMITGHGLPLVPGVLALRQFLEDAQIKMAVASSTYRAEVLFRMEKAGLTDLFSTVLGGDDVFQPKPAPDIFLKAAAALQMEPADCLVLEDSQSGVLAARAAGMQVFVVQNLSPVTEVMREKAHAIFPSHAALLQFLKGAGAA